MNFLDKPLPLPVQAYKDFADFRDKQTSYSHKEKLKDPAWNPCLQCEGAGKIYDPNYPSDPIEGRKFCPRVCCQKCNGTGKSDKIQFLASWREELRAWRAAKLNNRRHMADIRAIRKKLTKSERERIEKHFWAVR